MSARRWIAIGVVLAAAGAIASWRMRGDDAVARKTHSLRLDPQALRAQQAARLQRAKQLVARPKPATTSPRGKWPNQGVGPAKDACRGLIEPQCVLGPRDLCDALTELSEACDGGDADACLAVGQFLQDTPPRPLIATMYFSQACRIGEPAGCERLDALNVLTDAAPCEADVFRCAWRGYRAVPPDPALLDASCSLGVADSCAYMGVLADVEQSRGYYETGCQLGSPMLCNELAVRLDPSCKPDEIHTTCYPPDQAEEKAARDMACAAGFGSGCLP